MVANYNKKSPLEKLRDLMKVNYKKKKFLRKIEESAGSLCKTCSYMKTKSKIVQELNLKEIYEEVEKIGKGWKATITKKKFLRKAEESVGLLCKIIIVSYRLYSIRLSRRICHLLSISRYTLTGRSRRPILRAIMLYKQLPVSTCQFCLDVFRTETSARDLEVRRRPSLCC